MYPLLGCEIPASVGMTGGKRGVHPQPPRFPPPTTDTRPFRSRAPCPHTLVAWPLYTSAPIDRLYGLGPSHRSGLWVGRQTLFSLALLHPWSWEAGHGHGNDPTKATKDAKWQGPFTRR